MQPLENMAAPLALTRDLAEFLEREAARGNEFAASLIGQHQRGRRLTERQIEAAMRMMLRTTQRLAEKFAADTPVDDGFYLVEGALYKVKTSRGGNSYAQERVNGVWHYRGRPARFGITADHRVTPEIAAAHGAATGICIFCNAELDDAEGLGAVVGVGPVCARKHLGMTQRQLADHLGLSAAAAAPEAAPEV